MKESHGDNQRRLRSGIDGLDVVLDGGYPSEGAYLIEGAPGAGKTTLALHFVMAGAAVGERTTYVTLSESEAELRGSAETHGWELGSLEIVDLSSRQPDDSVATDYSVFMPEEVELADTVTQIRLAVERTRPARLVIDPLSAIKVLAGSSARYRQQIMASRISYVRWMLPRYFWAMPQKIRWTKPSPRQCAASSPSVRC